ncbi:MAG: 30S ribosomal protein S13 [Candidatus Marinimicrobia bacterium]|nr:30S ribosomal protein S13 [Candidatus Neomarinimicrobiota bacterium]TFB11606.1 30S ribosomal protein S13 [Candidatus Marinimicrobia bacterium MT.SAG.2]
MARIAGVDIPSDKKIKIALTYLFGIGRTRALKILEIAGVDPEVRTNTLDDSTVAKIREIISDNYVIEGALRTDRTMNIKRLMDIGSYRGLRHRKGLPVHGQRTSTNARTRKGKKRAVAGKKKVMK